MTERERKMVPLVLVAILAGSLCMGIAIHDERTACATDFSRSRDYDLSQHTPLEKIEIYSNEDFHSLAGTYEWDGDGSEEEPYIIQDYIFTASTQQPIFIWDVDLHWQIRNCFIEIGSVCGSSIINVANGVIANNTFHYRWNGLVLENVENMTIEDNVMEDNGHYGIMMTGTATNCIFQSNVMRRNDGYGMSVPTAVNCQFIGNQITNNEGNGILVVSATNCEFTGNTIDTTPTNGIAISTMTGGLIEDNSILACGERGVYVSGGSGGIVRSNSIENCASYGIFLGSASSGMTARQNVLLNNGVTCQVCDDGTNNIFEFNYFDDWTSPDANADDIVDEPYEIDGDASNQDLYPLASPDAVPPTTATSTTSMTTISTTTTSTTSTTSETLEIPLEFLAIGIGATVVLIGAILVIRMKK